MVINDNINTYDLCSHEKFILLVKKLHSLDETKFSLIQIQLYSK